jgi:hypothetical protein
MTVYCVYPAFRLIVLFCNPPRPLTASYVSHTTPRKNEASLVDKGWVHAFWGVNLLEAPLSHYAL